MYRPTTTDAARTRKSSYEDACAQADRLRENITAGASDGSQVQSLHDWVQQLAATEVARDLYSVLDGMVRRGRTPDECRAMVTDKLIHGPDDTWSGRGNDLKRAQHDAVRHVARELEYYGQED
ncbi:MAG TPA: hypothetical protein VNN79_19840 [Actinomycetota bacterium]|nr:hypothetical protein [Actinomycetota bacterium]